MANTRAQKTAQNLSTLTTAGDIAYASAAGTPARLGIGSSAQVLTVASGVPSWATPASGTPAYVGAVAYGAVNQFYGSTPTMISDLTTELVDTNTFHSTSSNTSRMTIPTGYNGKYRMELNISFAANSAEVAIYAYKNGSAITEGLNQGRLSSLGYTAGAPNTFSVGLVVTGVATDYFEFAASAGTLYTIDKARYSFTYLGA
jgi:hypothetical protein